MNAREKVILDTDFMNYMIRTKGDLEYYFNKIVTDLNIEPVIHEFLYSKEMMANPLVNKLVEEGKIKVIRYEDFLEDKSDIYYNNLFSDLYKYCNGREIEYRNANFITYQESGANLGEIHSVILALYTGYTLFFSNDNGAKGMVEAKINTEQYELKVKNVMDIFDEIALLEGKTMTKKDFATLTNGDKGRKERIKIIKEKWIE